MSRQTCPIGLHSVLSRRKAIAELCGSAFLIGGSDVAAAHSVVEPVEFQSRSTLLRGDIHLPTGTPAAGIVIVHGSGPEQRNTGLARRFAADGIAVLTYDKRGVGKSGGRYEAIYNISWDNLHLLAEDAVAAVKTLAAHPRLRGRKIGMFGISQAGWIIPIAAAENRRIAFFALWSGPVCRVSDELEDGIASAESAATATDNSARAVEGSAPSNVDLIRTYIAQIRAERRDVDPRTSLRELNTPGLWLFGGRDVGIPTELSRRQLAELIADGKQNFEQHTLPGAAHGMQGEIDEAYRMTIAWMRARAV